MTAVDAVLAVSVVAGSAVLIGAALHDVAARTVPNAACLAIAGAGLVARAADGTLLVGLGAGFAVFFVAALCWRRGYMGGGDVKLFGAVALLVPPSGVLWMLTATILAGGVLALVYLLGRGRAGRRLLRRSGGGPAVPRLDGLVRRAMRAERWRMLRGGPLPYATAIAFGTFYVLINGVSSS